MSKNIRLTLVLMAVAIAGVLIAAFAFGGDDPASPPADESDEVLVRPDSNRLSDGEAATFVEFLDFECEACGAAYPAIEELRATYGDRISFVVRYMPLHTNSVAAARAAEAAAEQGEFEAMYDLLFQNQAEWSHREQPADEQFFTYAEEIGLDMDRFREVFEDPATEARVERDAEDGRALGVTGTPTFFLDGEMIEVTSLEDLESQLATAAES